MTGNLTISYSPDLLTAIEDIVRKVFTEKQTTNEELITSKQVMELCHISHVTLQTWRDNGKIPFIKEGNKILYYRSEVLKALNNRTPTPANLQQAAA